MITLNIAYVDHTRSYTQTLHTICNNDISSYIAVDVGEMGEAVLNCIIVIRPIGSHIFWW